MKYSELYKLINTLGPPGKEWNDDNVCVAIKVNVSVAGTPTVNVKSMHSGFDWDSGKFIIYTEKPLVKADLDKEKQIKELQDKYGLLLYENRDLKSENKKLRKQIDDE